MATMWVFKAPHEVTSRVANQRFSSDEGEDSYTPTAATASHVFGTLTCLETGAVITVKHSSRGYRVQSHYLNCQDATNLSAAFADPAKAEAVLHDLAVKLGAIDLEVTGMPVLCATLGP